jgi:hypothetical protein
MAKANSKTAADGGSESGSWSVEDLEYLYLAKMQGVPYAVIAEELKRSVEACKSKWLKHDWDSSGIADIVLERNAKAKRAAFEQKHMKSVEDRLSMYRMRYDIIADRMEKAIDKLPEIKRCNWNPPKRKVHRGEEHVGLILSDLHIGHSHSMEETGGLSEYNLDIFIKRLHSLQKSVSDIYELHSYLYELPTLHIFCLGDIVDGSNAAGAWSPVYIDTPVYDQLMLGFEHLSQSIQYLLTIFKNIKFYGVRGNHGRIAPNGVEKDYANWDNVIYHMLRVKFADNPRIEFNIPKTWWIMENIKEHNFLLVHGDDVRGSGNAIKNLERFSASMSGMLKARPDYTICGHFHESTELTSNFGKMIINGSFVGADVYAIKNLHKYSRPEQKIFGINNSHGVTWRYDLDLGHM